MTHRVWLEVAINGPWGRDRQPNIPVQADDIVEQAVACAEHGAAIIHLHAYDPASGRQRDAFELYAPLIERIRARTDALVYPSIPLAGSRDSPGTLPPASRFDAIERLLEVGLIEWAAIDPGSTNLAYVADIARGKPGFVYANPESHIRYGLDLAQKYGMTPSYAIYEPGFLRLGAALSRAYPAMPMPVYRFMFSHGMTFGFPATPWALDAYLRLLGIEAPGAPWMVAGLDVDITPLIPLTVEQGGHVRTGLEDMPLGCPHDNITLTDRTRAAIEREGGRLASVADMRKSLQAHRS